LDRLSCIAETFFIGDAILRHDGCDALKGFDGKAQAGGRAVIEDVKGVTGNLERLRKCEESLGQGIDRIGIAAL
jgi:hypothetical protein